MSFANVGVAVLRLYRICSDNLHTHTGTRKIPTYHSVIHVCIFGAMIINRKSLAVRSLCCGSLSSVLTDSGDLELNGV